MYDKTGTLLVSGEIHPENRGFPVSMALSSDATKLLLSIINVNGGDITSELVFYDFTDKGKEEEDNIVATYTYIGALIPKIEFVICLSFQSSYSIFLVELHIERKVYNLS